MLLETTVDGRYVVELHAPSDCARWRPKTSRRIEQIFDTQKRIEEHLTGSAHGRITHKFNFGARIAQRDK